MPRATASRQRASAAPQPKASAAQAEPALRVAIHWRVDAAALRRAGHWEHAGEDVMLTLSVDVRGGVARAEATLSAGDRARALRLPRKLVSAPGVVTEAEGLAHLDAPPVLRATLAPGERARVLYARSGVLEFLGVAGGRYEVAGGVWEALER